jgi:hypothetical protein
MGNGGEIFLLHNSPPAPLLKMMLCTHVIRKKRGEQLEIRLERISQICASRNGMTPLSSENQMRAANHLAKREGPGVS